MGSAGSSTSPGKLHPAHRRAPVRRGAAAERVRRRHARTDDRPEADRLPRGDRGARPDAGGGGAARRRDRGRGVRHGQGDRRRRSTAGRRPGSERLVIGHESLGRVRRRPAARLRRRATWSSASYAVPDPVPCGACAHGRVRHVPQRAVHRARHQGDRRLRQRAVDRRGRLRRQARRGARGRRRADGADDRRRQGLGAGRADRRRGPGSSPKRVLVTGAGPIGLLAALLGAQRGLEVHVLDRVTAGPKPRARARDWARPTTTATSTRSWRGPARRRDRGDRGAAPRVRRHAPAPPPTASPCLTGVSSARPQRPGRRRRRSTATSCWRTTSIVGSVNANLRHYARRRTPWPPPTSTGWAG